MIHKVRESTQWSTKSESSHNDPQSQRVHTMIHKVRDPTQCIHKVREPTQWSTKSESPHNDPQSQGVHTMIHKVRELTQWSTKSESPHNDPQSQRAHTMIHKVRESTHNDPQSQRAHTMTTNKVRVPTQWSTEPTQWSTVIVPTQWSTQRAHAIQRGRESPNTMWRWLCSLGCTTANTANTANTAAAANHPAMPSPRQDWRPSPPPTPLNQDTRTPPPQFRRDSSSSARPMSRPDAASRRCYPLAAEWHCCGGGRAGSGSPWSPRRAPGPSCPSPATSAWCAARRRVDTWQ